MLSLRSAVVRQEARTGSMLIIIRIAAGTVTNPRRKLPLRAETHPVSQGRTDPPNPQTDKTHRESDERSAWAKNLASNKGKMGANAAPSTIMAMTWPVVPGKPTRAIAAASATTMAKRSICAPPIRNSSSDDNPREARNPHQ